MSGGKFSMDDYVPVNERIAAFYLKHPDGSLQAEMVDLSEKRVVMRAYAYRTPTDERPGIGYSSLEIPGRTPYTNGSEIENCETSAWGRAIAALGFEVKRGIATAEEVRNKTERKEPVESADPAPVNGEQEEMLGRVSRRGIIRKGSADAYKLTPSKGPEGWQFGFRLEIDGDKNIPQVVMAGALGNALFLFMGEKPEKLLGTVAKVSGLLYNVRGSKGSWYRLHVDRFENEDVILPAPTQPTEEQVMRAAASEAGAEAVARELRELDPVLPEPPEDVPLLAEAPTAPLFDDVA